MKQMPVQSTVPYRHETGASHRRAGCRHQTWSSGRQGCPGRSREQRYLRIHDRKSQNRRRYRISDPRRAGGHETVILLDTHVLVWLSTEPTKLSKQASRAPQGLPVWGIAISAITLWELAWLASHARVVCPPTYTRAARQYRDKQTICHVTVHNGTDNESWPPLASC